MKVVFAYLPAYHLGVKKFLFQQTDPNTILVLLDRDMYDVLGPEFAHIGRDIRAITSHEMKQIIAGLKGQWGLRSIQVLDQDVWKNLRKFESLKKLMQDEDLVAIDDDFTRAVVTEIIDRDESTVIWDDSVFIRWNKNTVPKEFPITPDLEVSEIELFRIFMDLAHEEAEKSSDWWRHVGALIFNDEKILFCKHNKHLPTKNTPNIDGDIRSNFGPGEEIDKCQAIHAEASAIVSAAREGVSLKGASILVTTFPCGGCAQLILEAGIKTVYFREGYSSMDTAKLLFQEQGIRIVLVKE